MADVFLPELDNSDAVFPMLVMTLLPVGLVGLVMARLLAAVILILGLFWRNASATGAFATLLGGHVVSAILFALSLLEVLSLHFTIIAGLLALVSGVIFMVVSRVSTPPLQEQIQYFAFHPETMQRQAPLLWWQDYRFIA